MKYGFQLPNGNLAKVEKSHNGKDRYACGEYTYKLIDSENDPLWTTESLDALLKVLSFDTEWYNTDEDAPGWGEFEQDELKPVQIITEIKPVALTPLKKVETKNLIGSVREIPKSVRKMYFGDKGYIADWPDEAKEFAILRIAKHEFAPNIGRKVGFSKHNIRMIYDVIDVPEECFEAADIEDATNSCAVLMSTQLYL